MRCAQNSFAGVFTTRRYSTSLPLFGGFGWLAAALALVAVPLLPPMRKLSREQRRCIDEAPDNAKQSAALSDAVARNEARRRATAG